MTIRTEGATRTATVSRRAFTLGGVGALGLGMVSCSSGGAGDVITLKVADSLPTEHVFSKDGIVPWMRMVEEAAKGKVKFEHYPAEQLAAADELLSATADGLTDIGYVVPSYFSDSLPLADIGALPGFYDDSVAATVPYWKFISEHDVEELNKQGVHPVMATVAPLYQPMVADGSIRQMADLSGRKLRSPGAVQDLAIKALGATPVSMPASDVFTSMERGTVDGTILPLASIEGYGIEGLLSSVTTNAPLGGTMPIMTMNKDKWDELPKQVQDAFAAVAPDAGRNAAKAWSQDSVAMADQLAQDGVEVIALTDQEVGAWTSSLSSVTDDWVEQREQDGHPAREAIATWKDLLAGA